MVRKRNSPPIAGSRASTEGAQDVVDVYFRTVAPYWKEIYQRRDVYALIHQRRAEMVLDFFDRLALPTGSPILEVGCGAGMTTVELARRGYRITAIDTVEPMIDLTTQHAAYAGVADHVKVTLGDAHHLPFRDELFSAVLAIGVIPWLHSPGTALQEMARVLKPAGHLIVNADNRWRLIYLLDPRTSPLCTRVRKKVADVLARSGLHKRGSAVRVHSHSQAEFDALLSRAGLEKIEGLTFGFGPFSFLSYTLPESVGGTLHRTLQTMADRRFPVFRSTGAQYIVLARKRANDARTS